MLRSTFALFSVLAPTLPAASAVAPQDPPLFPAARFQAGLSPESLVVGDFNEDGLSDVATANRDSDDVAVLLGDSSSKFRPPEKFPVMNEPSHLAVGDLDEDGHIDLAVVSEHHMLVLFGNGRGWFSPPIDLGHGGGFVRAHDLDADSHLDLVNLGQFGGLTVRLGDGQGGFGPDKTYGPLSSTVGLALGDLDGDGRLDAVSANQFTSELRWWKGLPGGAFASPVYVPVGSGTEFVTLGDLDGDADLDLIATSDSPSLVIVLPGDGLGNFGAPTSFHASILCEGATVADVNADGFLDVVAWLPGSAGVMLGDGAGGLGPIVTYRTAPGPAWLEVVDLDADDRVDLVFTGDPGSVTIGTLSGLGDGTFQVPERIQGGSHPTDVQALDFDQDGNLDLAVSNLGPFSAPYSDDVWLLAGDGAGGFSTQGHLSAGEASNGLIACDLSGDGRPDLAVANMDSNDFSVFVAGDEPSGFDSAMHFATGPSPRTLIAVDLDHDDVPEVVTLCHGTSLYSRGELAVHRGLGGGKFDAATTAAVGVWPSGLRAGDLDHDGHVDLVASCTGAFSQAGGVWIFRGDGKAAPWTPVRIDAGPEPLDVELADLSGDGYLDLIVLNNVGVHSGAPDYVSVMLGDGGGGFSPRAPYPVGAQAYTVSLADADGDGHTDVIACGSTLSVLRGDGTGSLGGAELFAPDESGPICVRDLDGDLRVDVVGTHFYLEAISILFGRLPPPPPCSSQTTWCSAKPNSQGCLPRICSSGAPSVGGPDDFAITAESVLSHQVGLLVWSTGGATQPLAGGTLCLAPPCVRTALQVSGGVSGVHDCSGTYSFPFTQAYMAAQGLVPGMHVFGQYWSRDPWLPPPSTIGLTDSIRFVIAL